LIQDRIELFDIENQKEKARLKRLLVSQACCKEPSTLRPRLETQLCAIFQPKARAGKPEGALTNGCMEKKSEGTKEKLEV
jgi:hypothetical protein